MKRYIRADVNSYSYTGEGFADDSIVLAHATKGKASNYDDWCEVTLVKDGFTCYVNVEDFYGNNTYSKSYPMRDIDSAISDFNAQVRKCGLRGQTSFEKIDFHLNEGYGKSLKDYLLGGFYDQLRNK